MNKKQAIRRRIWCMALLDVRISGRHECGIDRTNYRIILYLQYIRLFDDPTDRIRPSMHSRHIERQSIVSCELKWQ